jgi:hypothetical protein
MEPESDPKDKVAEQSMTVLVPKDLYAKLVDSSLRNERSLAAEVRFRLRASFSSER